MDGSGHEQHARIHALGLDLGAANVRLAVAEGTHARLLTDRAGRGSQPAAVSVDGGQVLLGERALARAATHPGQTVVEPLGLVGGAPVELGGRARTAEEVLSWWMRRAAAWVDAEAGPGARKMAACVAWESRDAVRAALMAAAARADVELVTTVEATVGVAVHHATSTALAEGVLLVVDAGARKLEVAAVSIRPGKLAVLGRASHASGGVLLDEALVHECLGEAGAASGGRVPDGARMCELRAACERARCALSEGELVAVSAPWLFGSGGWKLARWRLEMLAHPLGEALREALRRVLGDAGVRAGDLQGVLASGGLAPMPLLGRVILEETGARPLLTDVGAAARGAAVVAAIATGQVATARSSLVPQARRESAEPPRRKSAEPPPRVPSAAPPLRAQPPPAAPPPEPRVPPPVVPPTATSPPSRPIPISVPAPATATPARLGAPGAPEGMRATLPGFRPPMQFEPAPPSSDEGHGSSGRPALSPPPSPASSQRGPMVFSVPAEPRAQGRGEQPGDSQPPASSGRPSMHLRAGRVSTPSGIMVPMQGAFVCPATAEDLTKLPLQRALGAGDVDPVSLPVLLLTLARRKDLSGVLTLSRGAESVPLSLTRGGAVFGAVKEREALLAVFGWQGGTYRTEAGSVALAPGAKPDSVTKLAIEGMRSVLRRESDEAIAAALAGKLELAPKANARGNGLAETVGFWTGEKRFLKYRCDGSLTGTEAMKSGGLSRSAALGVLFVLDLFGGIDWEAPVRAAGPTLAQQIEARAVKASGGDYFELLGVHWSAEVSEMQEACRKIEAELGPGSAGEQAAPEAARAIVRLAQEARATLVDRNARIRYLARIRPDLDFMALSELLRTRAEALMLKGEEQLARQSERLRSEVDPLVRSTTPKTIDVERLRDKPKGPA